MKHMEGMGGIGGMVRSTTPEKVMKKTSDAFLSWRTSCHKRRCITGGHGFHKGETPDLSTLKS